MFKILLFSALPLWAMAQRNFVDGFIILPNQADTIKGLIDDRNWGRNPGQFSFQPYNKEIVSYSINEVQAFGSLNKEYYIVKNVDLDVTPYDNQSLLKNPDRIIKKDTIIALLALVQAENSLFYFTDNTFKEHFFYQNKSGRTIELIRHKYLKGLGEKTYEIEDNNYLKQLDTLFADCSSIHKPIHTTYTSKSLTDLFITYSECKGCNYLCFIKKDVDVTKITFGVVAGASRETKAEYFKAYSQNTTKNERFSDLNTHFGLNMSIYSKRNRGKQITHLECLYEKETFKSLEGEYSAQINYLNVNALYRSRLLLSKAISPFYGIGLGLRSLLSAKADNKSGDLIFDFDKVNTHMIGECGMVVGKVQFSVRLIYRFPYQNKIDYQYKLGAEAIDIITFDKLNFQAILSYQFK